MVAEIGLLFVEREVFFDDPGTGGDGEDGRLDAQRVVRITDRAAEPLGEKWDRSQVGLLGRSRITADAVQKSEFASNARRFPLTANAADRHVDLRHVADAGRNDHRLGRAGDLLDEREEVVVARSDFVRVDQRLEKGGGRQAEGCRDEQQARFMREWPTVRELPLGNSNRFSRSKRADSERRTKLFGPDGLKFDGPDAALGSATDHLGGQRKLPSWLLPISATTRTRRSVSKEPIFMTMGFMRRGPTDCGSGTHIARRPVESRASRTSGPMADWRLACRRR